jgi:hypothetical protein
MELVEDQASVSNLDDKSNNGLENLSAINAPESIVKSKKDKGDKDKDKKKKKKKDKGEKGERQLKVKDYKDPQDGSIGPSDDEDVDHAI